MSSSIQRRDIIKGGAGATLATLAQGFSARKASAAEASHVAQMAGATGAFTQDTVRQIAKRLAAAPYAGPDQTLPAAIDNLNFDQFRGIEYREDKALW